LVEASKEACKESVAGIDVTDAGQAQLFHKAVLQRSVGTFHTALRLAGVRTQDLDVQLGEGATELCHALAALRVLPDDAEDRVLVRIESHRSAVSIEVAA
jgi:hypothetical protein